MLRRKPLFIGLISSAIFLLGSTSAEIIRAGFLYSKILYRARPSHFSCNSSPLEKLIKTMIEGRLGEEKFTQILSDSFSKGGVGIHQGTAKLMAEKVQKLLEEARDVTRIRKEIEEKAKLSKKEKLIQRLRTYLLDVYEGGINSVQLERLEEAIALRLFGDFQKKDFQRKLGLSLEKGGVGFNKRTARNLSIYLEKLIAQGIKT